MGRASFALLFLPLAVQVVVGQQVGPSALPPQREIIVSTDRVDRLERWLKAVDQHEPGEIDDAAGEIGRSLSSPSAICGWMRSRLSP